MKEEKFTALKLMKKIQTFYNNVQMVRQRSSYDDPFPEPILGNYSLGYCRIYKKIIGYQRNLENNSRKIMVGCTHDSEGRNHCFIPFSEMNFFELKENFKQDFIEEFASLLTKWKDYKEFSAKVWGQEEFYQEVIQTHNKWIKFPKEKKLNEIKEIFNIQKRANGLKIKQKELENILMEN